MTEPQDTPPAESAQIPAEGPPTDAVSLVAACLNVLAAKAWEGMGLVPNPQTKKVERNLDDAQVAIDAVTAMADVLRARVAEGERREIETLVTNLRINFVEQKSRASQPG